MYIYLIVELFKLFGYFFQGRYCFSSKNYIFITFVYVFTRSLTLFIFRSVRFNSFIHSCVY